MLLVETEAQHQVVAHTCTRALAAGVVPGMRLSAARAAIAAADLVIEPHDRHRTRRALRALAIWCHRLSPLVAEEDGEGICLDITGCTHLFGGEERMIERTRSALDRLGFSARIAVAPTFAAARALARHGAPDSVILRLQEIGEAVDPLPIAALGVDEATVAGLAEVNVRQIGALLRLPRPAVAARFGDEVLGALDRLLGRAPEFIEPIRPAEPTRVERVFEGPCGDLETIGAACRSLLERLCALLAAQGRGMVEWRIVLARSDLEPLAIFIRHCVPRRDASHLWGLLAPRLERAHLGFGVEGVAIMAVRTRPVRHCQGRWWEDPSREEGRSSPAEALIDTLVNRLGPEAVLRAELRESHVPERASVMRSVLDSPAASWQAAMRGGDRPTRLLAALAMARVIALTPDGPISRVEWSGGSHRITACVGPERIKGEWWSGQRLLRDYFKVQDEHGQWLWVCRDHVLGAWLVHGVWE